MTNEQVIRKIIDSFFRGVDFFEEPGMGIWIAKHREKKVNRFDLQAVRERGFIEPPLLTRIVSEDTMWGYIPEFETLTFEPREGGQYEVAIRIWSEDKWRGYKINDFDSRHYLVGINTRGH
jgi:hypothetical protein